MAIEGRSKQLVTLLLGVLVVAIWGYNGYRLHSGLQDPVPGPAEHRVSSTPAPGVPVHDSLRLFDPSGRDPFVLSLKSDVPAASTAGRPAVRPERPPLLLQGIVGGAAVVRVLNGPLRVVHAGDTLAGARVVRIEAPRMVLRYRGASFTFSLDG